MNETRADQSTAGPAETPQSASGSDRTGEDLEPLDLSQGADVVLVEYGNEMDRPRAFHHVPDWLEERVTREAVLAANPHEGVALFCQDCDCLLNGARTGGVCPICGEQDRSRVLCFLAELDEDRTD